MNKAMVAMSGGVDSSVAAFLTLQNGYNAVGATMKLVDKAASSDELKICGSSDDILDAKSVCNRLGIEHLVYDMRDDFSRNVMKRFAEVYLAGATPNPCIICNKYIKFGVLLDKAESLGFDKIVTGHYAAVEYDDNSDRYLLKKAVDHSKDQTYFLYTLNQHQLSRILFPLGSLSKPEVREIAEAQGFINARKHDSQDICFVPDGNYVNFLEGYLNRKFECGSFIDLGGNIIGNHSGAIKFTIGQRKGLGMGFNKPMYVCRKDMQKNTVTLGDNSDLFSKRVTATDISMIACKKIERPMRVTAKVRYSQREEWATLEQTDDNTIVLEFDNAQRAVAPGQAVVCYDDDIVVCGGTITA